MYSLENGHSNRIGFGGYAFTKPDFAKDILSEATIISGKICITYTKCVELMRSNSLSGFVVRDKAHTNLYQQFINNNY